jgi:ubiquinone/menaquinone biosynthesis C-methylase UbiE
VSSSASIDQEAHWDRVYREKRNTDLGWFQPHPALSLELITAAAPNRDARIIDVGGGDSLLVDHLLALGYGQLTVLDISRSAVERAQVRLGTNADKVRWIVGDVMTTDGLGLNDLWHDRALFIFCSNRRRDTNTLPQLPDLLRPAAR